MNTPLVVEWVKRGGFVDVPSAFRPGETEPYMVISPCGDLAHVFYCSRCNVNLANVGQLEIHFEKGGAHRIVVWCGSRRVYEEAAAPASLQIGAVL